jgi:hypothetical protein
LKRRSNGLAALFVDLGAVFDQELAHGVLVVDGCPLCATCFVSIRGPRAGRAGNLRAEG